MTEPTWSAWFLAVVIVAVMPTVSSKPSVVGPVFGLCTLSFYLGVTVDV